MTLINDITNFLSQGWLPNLIGLVGGLLGLWTFIDSYLVSFRPKIYIGTRIIIDTVEDRGYTRLNSIICSLELCNHRKKYGVIYDFAVRIYKADEINSDKAIYYASEMVDKVPVNIDELAKQEYRIFNPITVLPDSNNSVNLVLSELLHRSKMDIATGSSYYIEAYYQKEPKGEWFFVDKLYLFNKGQLDLTNKKYILFTVLNNDTTREKLKERVKPQKTSLYTGASQKYLNHRVRLYSYKLFKNPLNRVKDIFVSIPFYLHFLADKIFDKFVKIPIIKLYGKRIDKLDIKIGSPELKSITEIAYEQIFTELQELAKQINIGGKKEAEITVKKDNDYIIVSRYKLSIKFYKSGDSSIRVQELNSMRGSRLTYSLELKNGVWNKKYWHLDNYGFIKIKSFVVRVLDAFVIHSNY